MFSNPLTVKVAALSLLGLLRLVAGLSPLIFSGTLKSWGQRRVEVATSLALCFGGGVLLASCMLHMIPEVRESMALLDWKISFPLAELIVSCGFFLVYLVEEIVQSLTKPIGLRSVEAEMRINGKVAPLPMDCAKGYGQTLKEAQGSTRHILVLSALSLHSALEGLALGLQPTPAAVWMLFTAVSAHAVAVLFSIGLELVSDGTPEVQVVVFMAVLALSSPLGGSLGLAATADGEKAHAGAVATLQGLAAGAVLFVTFFEVLEKEKKKGGFIRFFCVVLGFVVMAGLQTLGTFTDVRLFVRTSHSIGDVG